MGLLRPHLAAVAAVVLAVTAAGAVFTFERPAYHPDALPAAPTELPYLHARYDAAHAQLAFALAGVKLIHRTREASMTDLSDAARSVEVTVFGDPAAVKALGGSFDYVLDASGHWVHYPRTCAGGVRAAAQWRENVRVIVRCGAGDAALLRRVDSALAALPRP